MKYYFAPMEGITGHIYRNTYNKFFHNIDKYFAPFVVPNKSRSLKSRELIDLLPDNNRNINLVPQILTNDAEGFIFTAKKIQALGYDEVNLNLGCPAGTVVSKNRGSGFLSKQKELDMFLDEIFKVNNMKISIKTRLGKENPEEFYELMNIYNKYPIYELTIHPRTQKDFYGNKPNTELFKYALNNSTNTICYNGDIFTNESYNRIINEFQDIKSVMIGRGILANPGLLTEIREDKILDKYILKEFHDELFNSYLEVFDKDKFAIFRMKELWGYMSHIFSNSKEYMMMIRKCQDLSEYEAAVIRLFNEQNVMPGKGLFS